MIKYPYIEELPDGTYKVHDENSTHQGGFNSKEDALNEITAYTAFDPYVILGKDGIWKVYSSDHETLEYSNSEKDIKEFLDEEGYTNKEPVENRISEIIKDQKGSIGLSDKFEEFLTNEVTEEEFIDILSGKYGSVYLSSNYGSGDNRKGLWEHPFATPENMGKVIKNIKEQFKKHSAPLDPDDELLDDFPNDPDEVSTLNRHLEDILYYYKLPKEAITDMIETPQDYNITTTKNTYRQPSLIQLSDNKSVDKSHLYLIGGKYPKILSHFTDHGDFDESLQGKILSNPEALENLNSNQIMNLVNKDYLRPDYAENLLNTGRYGHSVSKLLNHIPEDRRNKIIRQKLGIEGGYHLNSFEEEYDTEGVSPEEIESYKKEWMENSNWDNWRKGPSYDPEFVKHFTTLGEVNDEYADHIKRHETFRNRINLYENDNVNPEHGAEMFTKWYNNLDVHGYDSDELNDYLRTHYRDEFYDDVYDEARERAEEDYSFNEWIDDNEGYIRQDVDVFEYYSDDIYNELRENYDWSAPNPDFDQGAAEAINILENSPLFLKDGRVSKEQFINLTGENPDDYVYSNIDWDENDTTSLSEMKDILYDEGAIRDTIDYGDHDDYVIDEHEDYEDRLEEVIDEYKEKFISDLKSGAIDTPDEYWESYDDAIQYSRAEYETELVDAKFDNAHQNLDFAPEHIKSHPTISSRLEEMRERERQAEREKIQMRQRELSSFIDSTSMKQRSTEHSYGQDLNYYEMVKDYADANGGKMDIGRMTKMYPNLKDKWKQIFGGQGKISSEQVQEKIDNLPKTKYEISYERWGPNQCQNLNHRDQVVVRLDHTPESIGELKKDPELYNIYEKIAEVSRQSGHPTNKNSIGWARIDVSDPENWFIDEVQTDFDKAARDYLKKQGHGDKADLVDKIMEIHKGWRKNIMNYIKKTAKQNGAKYLSTHTPESKASHTKNDIVHTVYKDSYGKYPKLLGFKPTKLEQLPLSNKGRERFIKKPDSPDLKKLLDSHMKGYSYSKSLMMAHEKALEETDDPKVKDIHLNLRNQYKNKFTQHYNRIMDIDANLYNDLPNPVDFDEDPELKTVFQESIKTGKPFQGEYDKALDKPIKKEHQGHILPLTPEFFKKSLHIAATLIKGEVLYFVKSQKNIRDNKLLNGIIELRKALDTCY